MVIDSNVSMNTLRKLITPQPNVQANTGVGKFKRAASNVVKARQVASEKKTMEQLRKVTQQLKKNENTKKKLATATAPQRVAIARRAAADKTRGGESKGNTVSNLFRTGLPPVEKPKPTKRQLNNAKASAAESDNIVKKNMKIQALIAKYNRSTKSSKIHREINGELKSLGHKGLPPKASNVGGQTGRELRKLEKGGLAHRKKSKR